MAHLRSIVRTCQEPYCTARSSEALYGIHNESYGEYCKKHAAKALANLKKREQDFSRRYASGDTDSDSLATEGMRRGNA